MRRQQWEKAKRLLELEPRWKRNMEIELLLIRLVHRDVLEVEFAARLVDAEAALSRERRSWYERRLESVLNCDDPLRGLYSRLVEDMHRVYLEREGVRGYRDKILRSGRSLYLWSLSSFVVAVTLLGFGETVKLDTAPGSNAPGPSAWEVYWPLWNLTALSAGALGATFSLMTTMRSRLRVENLDGLRSVSQRGLISKRVSVGAGAATLLLYFLQSQAVESQLLPSFVETGSAGFPANPASWKDAAIVVVWFFLAGFSERLVPSLLARRSEADIAIPASATDRDLERARTVQART